MAAKFCSTVVEFFKFSLIFIPYFCVYLIYSYICAFFKLVLPVPKKSLENEIILITGCGTGIGQSVAFKLAKFYKEKIALVLWDYNEQALEQTASEIRNLGCIRVSTYCLDVSNQLQVSDAARRIREEVGDVTILINNAGVSHNRAFMKLTPEQIQRTIRINFLAHFWSIREFLPKMIENNHGHIAATCSMGGILAVRGNVPYFSSKFALRAAFFALKDELILNHPDKTGIHFTILYPWFTKTPLLNLLDIRFRFPKLMPLVEPECIAEDLIIGIQKNKEEVLVPNRHWNFVWILKFAPVSLRNKIHEFGILEYRGMEDDHETVLSDNANIGKEKLDD